MRDNAGISIFAQGDTTCAVCAPSGVARQLVIECVETMNPTASGRSGWKVFAGKLPDGGLNPRACPHDGERHHWLLVRRVVSRSVSDPKGTDRAADVSRETMPAAGLLHRAGLQATVVPDSFIDRGHVADGRLAQTRGQERAANTSACAGEVEPRS